MAVRVDAAADLTEIREYADLPETGRRAKAVADETAWLSGQWDSATDSRVEVRYLSNPQERRLSCAVLGRVSGPGEQFVLPAALTMRRRLAGMPRHVKATEVTSVDEVEQWLTPFTPDHSGIAEIRKRIRAGRPARPDAGVAYYLAVEPLTSAATSWEPLWEALAAQPYPTMLTMGLESHAVTPAFGSFLHELATVYGRLARPGTMPDGLWTSGVTLAPDAFAVDAAKLYSDAARRYASRMYRLRVSLASSAPLSDSLLELVGATISPPAPVGQESVLTGTFQGPPQVAVRPGNQQEYVEAWRNTAAVEFTRWDGHYVRDLPLYPPSGIRLLAEVVDSREASAAIRLPLAVHGSMPGFPVLRPSLSVESVYTPRGAHLALGRQLVSDRLSGSLGVDLGDLTRHALLVGTTGSGKTNTCLSLCEQLWRDHHVPFLVMEPVNTSLDDYRWLATRPGMSDLAVFTVGNEEVAPFRLNPFEVPPGVRIGTHIAGLLSCFDAAFGLWDPLPAIYNRALRAAYARRGIVATEVSGDRHQGNWPTLRDLIVRMREETERLDYSGEVRSNIVAASQLRAESLADGACSSTLDCAVSYPVAELLRRPTIIELAEVGDNEKEQSLLTALILQTMTEYYKANRNGGEGLAHVTVLEEAHRLLGKATSAAGENREGNARVRAAEAFANTLSENRKYGEGMVIVEQIPGKLVEDAYKNTNLKIMHRLPAEDDRQLVGATMGFSPDQERHASALAPFTAFAYHDGLDRPALISVPNVRAEAATSAGLSRAPLATDTDLATTWRQLAGRTPGFDRAWAPYPECAGCGHRCVLRAHAATVAQPEHVAELKRRVAEYPNTAAAQSQWWIEMTRWVRRLTEEVPINTPFPEKRDDYQSCVFVHLSRGAWRAEALPWVRLFRQRVNTGGEGRREGTG